MGKMKISGMIYSSLHQTPKEGDSQLEQQRWGDTGLTRKGKGKESGVSTRASSGKANVSVLVSGSEENFKGNRGTGIDAERSFNDLRRGGVFLERKELGKNQHQGVFPPKGPAGLQRK